MFMLASWARNIWPSRRVTVGRQGRWGLGVAVSQIWVSSNNGKGDLATDDSALILISAGSTFDAGAGEYRTAYMPGVKPVNWNWPLSSVTAIGGFTASLILA